ncbi:F-BOX/LEUCINE RICH REPEAT PROTEIN [Ceraceosorus bombacis]|uniref:F-BOX/LEUCINE RICH REPEAT PROTEIN n=1 Tax=Ceraceosorus bombacis TaxID=401625 RepID=A0A0P1BGY0_9BASI|nr:F-BOX/LEUCINE RICH REPEAT PROTEIN [Ceraceosorus bombacis]
MSTRHAMSLHHSDRRSLDVLRGHNQRGDSLIAAPMDMQSKEFDLPAEIISKIIAFIGAKTILRARAVCHKWNHLIARSEQLWRVVAVEWGLIPHIDAPLPSPGTRQSQCDGQALLESSGFFSSFQFFKSLCREYLALTNTWINPRLHHYLNDCKPGREDLLPRGGFGPRTDRRSDLAFRFAAATQSGHINLFCIDVSQRAFHLQSLHMIRCVKRILQWSRTLQQLMTPRRSLVTEPLALDWDLLSLDMGFVAVWNGQVDAACRVEVWKEQETSAYVKHTELTLPRQSAGRLLKLHLHYPFCGVLWR